jgi:hypothetical protein
MHARGIITVSYSTYINKVNGVPPKSIGNKATESGKGSAALYFKVFRGIVNYLISAKKDKNASNIDTLLHNRVYEFASDLSIIAEYMLFSRFQPATKTPKNKALLNKSSDLISFLNLKKHDTKQKSPVPLDIIAFFKLLENFIMKRAYKSSIDDLEMGGFKETAVRIVDNLPKLLLDIDSSANVSKKRYLEVIFSAIIVYRQFKVKTVPNLSTITSEYTGDSIAEFLINEFSQDEIKQ